MTSNLYPQNNENRSILDVIKFTDATEAAGLNNVPRFEDGKRSEFGNFTHVEAADYDGDGDTDLYVGSYDPVTSTYKQLPFLIMIWVGSRMFHRRPGFRHTGKESSATFADYDNDGFLDLFIVKEGGDLLYRNAGKGVFEDVTSKTEIGSKTSGNKALFFDLDHDGDLDLFEARSNSNLVFRNNGDGTFKEQD